jgi:hypothetical protein
MARLENDGEASGRPIGLHKGLIFGAICLAALAVVLELLLATFYSVTAGQFFYTREPRSGAPPAAFQPLGAVFHPYLGYTLSKGRVGDYLQGATWRANNLGFQNIVQSGGDYCCDYPYSAALGEYLVGVFGGSVGSGFALQAQLDGSLAAALSKLPEVGGRRVRILNFAQPGFRQPQQLAALSYFQTIGQRFDLVVNIDGFNEVVTSWRNWSEGVEPSYPADTLWGAWGRQLEQHDIPIGDRHFLLAGYHQLAARATRDAAQECWSALCYYGALAAARYHAWREMENRSTAKGRERITLFPTQAQSSVSGDADIYGRTAELWRRASMAMANLAAVAGSRYVHVLQPNQWYRAAGDYQPIAADHPYKWVVSPVNRGYEALLKEGQELVSKGVLFLDLSLVFSGQDFREVFLDDCCHYTDKGYHAIYGAMAEALSRQPVSLGKGER